MNYRDEPSGITFREGDAGSHERYQTLGDAIGDGIYQLDAEGRFVAVNDVIVEETGYDTGELLDEHVSVLFDAEAVARIERETERLRTSAGGRSEPLELAVETASGERIYWELRVSLVGGPDAFQGTIGVAREITDRKRQERDHQRVAQALNAARDGIGLLDDGEFVYVNDAYAETFGYDPGEMIGEHWESLGIEANPDRFHDEVLPTVADEGQWSGATTCVRRDGSTFLAEHSLTDTEDGGLVCVVRDATERRERERELREKERRYEAIFEDPNILVGLLEPDGTVLDINQTAMDYIDADLETVTGEPFWETPWWGEVDELQSRVEGWVDRAASGEYVDFEADLTSPGGEEYVVEGVFRPVTDDEGEVVSVIVSDRDITERRQRERALEESEQRYRTLAENFPNGIVTLFDNDLTYTLAAGQGFDSLPLDPDEVEGAHYRDVWDGETAEALGPLFQAVLDGRERSVEVSYAGREWVIHGVPITDQRGEVLAGMTMAQDITEQKEQRRRVEESERRYRTLVDNFPNGSVGLIDEDMRYVTVGGSPRSDRDVTADELEGRPVAKVLSPELAEELVPRYRAALRGESSSFVYEHTDSERYTRFRTFPVRDEEGDVFAAMGMSQDITDRKHREAELERALDLLHKTERIADVGGWEIDVDTMDVFWTDHLFEVLEVDDDEEPPLDEALDMYHEADRSRVEEAVQTGLVEGVPFETEARIEVDGDDHRWLRLQGVPETHDGEVVALRGAALDVTERREREQFLREMQEIAADSDRAFEARLQAMLDLGCERFDMELGGLAAVDPSTGRFEVETTNGDHGYLRSGERCPISEMHRRESIEARDTRGIANHEGNDGDLCEQLGIESSLSTYLELDGAADRTFWFVSGDPREEGFSETDRRLHQQMGQWIRHELEHQHDADQLAAVNRLNAVARDINRELAQQSTRESIESVVCERLSESESYEFAWIGTTDEGERTVDPSTVATTPGSPDSVAQLDREWPTGLTETALRTGELQVRQGTDRAADEADLQVRGINSVAALPIAYEDQTYGALTVYSERSNAFDGEERAVIRQLGEIVGLAMAAVEREQQLEYERERLEFVNRLLRHNLLNGLNAIRAQASLLETRVEGDGERFVTTIAERVDDMADLIETMRSLMTIITDEQHELREVDLGSVLRNELQKVRKIHRDAEFTFDGDLDRIDAVRANGVLSEVFENLLVNAVQHTDAETPRVTVSVERDDDSVTVHVADNGPGVPDELKDRVFEKGEKNFDSPGTGFGLYLAQEIIEGCGGTISVHDNDPTGAVFSVTLDRA